MPTDELRTGITSTESADELTIWHDDDGALCIFAPSGVTLARCNFYGVPIRLYTLDDQGEMLCVGIG